MQRAYLKNDGRQYRYCGQNFPVQTLTRGAKGGHGGKVRVPPCSMCMAFTQKQSAFPLAGSVHCAEPILRAKNVGQVGLVGLVGRLAHGCVCAMFPGISTAHGTHANCAENSILSIPGIPSRACLRCRLCALRFAPCSPASRACCAYQKKTGGVSSARPVFFTAPEPAWVPKAL